MAFLRRTGGFLFPDGWLPQKRISGSFAPDYALKWRVSPFPEDLSESIKRPLATLKDLVRVFEYNRVRSNEIVIDPRRKGLVIVKFVLLAVRIDDDIPCKLTVRSSSKAMLWKLRVRFNSVHFGFDLEPAHYELVHSPYFPGYDEDVVALRQLAS